MNFNSSVLIGTNIIFILKKMKYIYILLYVYLFKMWNDKTYVLTEIKKIITL
jgi:hypothetical protein